jgi:hypothetical protein
MQANGMTAATALPVFYRTYSRRKGGGARESWSEVCTRTLAALVELGKLTDSEAALLKREQDAMHFMPSGRWLWVGGTEWSKKPENFSGSYNCSSTRVTDVRSFGLMMDLAMQGVGTGAMIEERYIKHLPPVQRRLAVTIGAPVGSVKTNQEDTEFWWNDFELTIAVGDSRQGWVAAYQQLIEVAMSDRAAANVAVVIDLSAVRRAGTPLKGFGGTANPAKLADMFGRVATVLNGAIGRKLTSVECCLLIDEAAACVVAGNIRRSAGMRQGDSTDAAFATAKDNLWQQDAENNWTIDPDRDALRMANHTRVFHQKPTLEECTDAVRKQFYSGEGAIQYAPEAIARANADVIQDRRKFIRLYEQGYGAAALPGTAGEKAERLDRYGLNPCFAAGTLVKTFYGAVPIENLVGTTATVFSRGEWIEVSNFRVTGEQQAISKLVLSTGDIIYATAYHNFILADGEKRQLKDLAVGDALLGLDAKEFVVTDVTLNIGIADKVYCCTIPGTHQFTLACGLVVGQCGEIVLADNFCNLGEVHLNTFAPFAESPDDAFRAAAISVCALLHHEFPEPRYQASREHDPIVGVSITGLFDYFVWIFGVEWLKWWEAGRPDTAKGRRFRKGEADRLNHWRVVVENTVAKYCANHGLRIPNRCTTVQPAGSKSLLTGASCGWHPPKAQRYIRRITFAAHDPVALACIAYGYSVIPGMTDKDAEGKIYDDPFDPAVTEWLVEIPVAVAWADMPGADEIQIENFSALAQFDFMMVVQQNYTRHNTSATLEFRESEIEPLATAIYSAIQNDDGYISAALLSRSDDTFPRMPFEKIDLASYEALIVGVEDRRTTDDFYGALLQYDSGKAVTDGPAGCDGDKCLFGEKKPG